MNYNKMKRQKISLANPIIRAAYALIAVILFFTVAWLIFDNIALPQMLETIFLLSSIPISFFIFVSITFFWGKIIVDYEKRKFKFRTLIPKTFSFESVKDFKSDGIGITVILNKTKKNGKNSRWWILFGYHGLSINVFGDMRKTSQIISQLKDILITYSD